MGTTDTAKRDAFIKGLLDLAGYLTDHPDLPVPESGTEILVGVQYVEDGGLTEVTRAGTALAADTARTGDGGYDTARSFGPLGYRVFALTRASMARHHAEASYRGCVIPDEAA